MRSTARMMLSLPVCSEIPTRPMQLNSAPTHRPVSLFHAPQPEDVEALQIFQEGDEVDEETSLYDLVMSCPKEERDLEVHVKGASAYLPGALGKEVRPAILSS